MLEHRVLLTPLSKQAPLTSDLKQAQKFFLVVEQVLYLVLAKLSGVMVKTNNNVTMEKRFIWFNIGCTWFFYAYIK